MNWWIGNGLADGSGLTLDCRTVDGSEIGRTALADSSPDETSGWSP